MDANCHDLTGRLSRALTHPSIGLHEITKDFLGSLCPNTHARGSEQIDGVWTTSDITSTAVKWLPFEESPGDHPRTCIFDFSTLLAIGSVERKISLPKCRCLISSNPRAVAVYTAEMERQFDLHRIEERLAAIDDATTIINFRYQMSIKLSLTSWTSKLSRYKRIASLFAAIFIAQILPSHQSTLYGTGDTRFSNV